MILPLIAAALNPPATADLERLVAGLGPHSDYRSVEAIGRFGCRAVPALVRQLEVVRTLHIPGYQTELYPRAERVVWTIATLRHITETDFYAPRPREFDPDSTGGQFLAMGAPPDSTKFFGVWMSRGSYFFAPPVQQRAIIDQWRRYSASGACRNARRNTDFTFWLYGDRFGMWSNRLSYNAQRSGGRARAYYGAVRIGDRDR